ncbi:MAG TPA: hypothetical protein VKC34_03710 [Blastocatellia bacterium]|nr:hypothetical protein [Blastocatellia bacterium]
MRPSPALAFGAALAVVFLAATGWLISRSLREKAPEQAAAAPSAPAPSAPSPLPVPSPPPTPPPSPVTVVAQLNDGAGQLVLDEEGRLSGADDLPPPYRSRLKQALSTRRIERSSRLEGLARPPSSLMSSDDRKGDFSLTEPVAVVLMSDRPTFRWSQMQAATGYVVEVYDGKFNLAATSPQLSGQSWRPPQPLRRGELYAWQVKAIKDGLEYKSPRPPAPQARFRILDLAKANELAKARRAYASSHLTMGLLYAEAGLLKEAEHELRALQKANPRSEVARSLLAQVQALGRRSR